MAVFRGRVVVHRDEGARRALDVASLPLMVVSLAIATAGGALRTGLALAVSGPLLLAAAIAAIAAGRERGITPDEETATVEVDEEAVTITTDAGSRRVPRESVAFAFADGDRATLRLTDGAQVVATLKDEAAAGALVAALGPEIAARQAVFPLGRRAQAVSDWMSRNLGPQALIGAMTMSFFGLLVPWMLAMGTGVATWEILHLAKSGVATGIGGAFAAAAALTSAMTWLSLFRRREIVVGSDGVLVRGLFGRRFIPFTSIQLVVDVEAGVRLVLKGGDGVLLPKTAGNEGLAARIRAAMSERGRADVPAERLAALDRGGRSAAEWRRDLEKLAQKGDGYRDEAFSGERLAGVVEDASVPADRRVGAALILATAGDEPAKKRVRIAAAACADDDMRAALEEAAEGELAEGTLERAARKLG